MQNLLSDATRVAIYRRFVADFLYRMSDMNRALGKPILEAVRIENNKDTFRIVYGEELNVKDLNRFYDDFILQYYEMARNMIGEINFKIHSLNESLRMIFIGTQAENGKRERRMESLNLLASSTLEYVERESLLDELETIRESTFVFYERENAKFMNIQKQILDLQEVKNFYDYVLANRVCIKSIKHLSNPSAYVVEVTEKEPNAA